MQNEMRDRLAGLLVDSSRYIDEQRSEVIADYLIENGVIVPPCKVGDTVYAYCEYFGVLKYNIGNFHIGFMGKNEENYLHWDAAAYADYTDELLDEMDFDLDAIGKYVFFTREEAEKALAERSVNNG